MIYIPYILIVAYVFIMHKYHKIKSEYLLASAFLVFTNILVTFTNYFSFFDGAHFDDEEIFLFVGFIAAACGLITKITNCKSFNAYAFLSVAYTVLSLEGMIIDYGEIDRGLIYNVIYNVTYYTCMYGLSLFLVYTVIYDRLAPARYIFTHYVRKLGTIGRS